MTMTLKKARIQKQKKVIPMYSLAVLILLLLALALATQYYSEIVSFVKALEKLF